MTTGSMVCITDGDTEALVHLRGNVERNKPEISTSEESTVSCHQLIWGRETSTSFLEQYARGQAYDVLIASDIRVMEASGELEVDMKSFLDSDKHDILIVPIDESIRMSANPVI